MDSRTFRRQFVAGLFAGLHVVWPVLSGLLILVVALGLVVGWIEGWSIQESIYFAFVTGLTIGYGDLAPKLLLTRTLAVGIGLCGGVDYGPRCRRRRARINPRWRDQQRLTGADHESAMA